MELGSDHCTYKDSTHNCILPCFFPSELAIMWVHMPQEHHGTEQDNYIKEILALTAEEILLESTLFFFFFGVLWTGLLQTAWPAYADNLYSYYCTPCVFFPKLHDIYLISFLRNLRERHETILYRTDTIYIYLFRSGTFLCIFKIN